MTHPVPPLSSGRTGALRNRNESGAAIVEFSLVVGLFVFLLYGLIAFGMALAVKQTVTNAASAGARAAVGAPSEADAVTRAVDQADEAMSEFSGNYDPPVATVADCAGAAGRRCITVTITAHPVVPTGMGVLIPDPLKSTAVVQIS